MIYYDGQLKDAQFNIVERKSHHKTNSQYKVTRQCQDIFTFDIETTSFWLDEHNKIIGYEPGHDSEWWENKYPMALCYIWQFSFNETVYFGRELESFKNLLNDLVKQIDGAKCIFYVHNLSFEFQFLSNILTWESVFARNTHKPMKCIASEYPTIEWRCSYVLTGLSLSTWGKQIGLPKMDGDLDYEVLRTPKTILTQEELKYCERDCEVVFKGIQKYKERYKSLFSIPLTQTGTIRREAKSRLQTIYQYNKWIKTLVPNAQMYQILVEVFSGGFTHANRLHSGNVIDYNYIGCKEDEVYIQHLDFASSYPTSMICEKYPMTNWIYSDLLIDESRFEEYAFIYKLEFKDIESINFNTYIQESKCRVLINPKRDNGRIIKASDIVLYCTEVDYQIIRNNYKWGELIVLDAYESEKGYLPKPLVEYILELYGNKTSLKPKDGEELTEAENDLYMQSKQYINSCFGMMVTALCSADVSYDEKTGEWSIGKLNEEKLTQDLDKLRNIDGKVFLSYSWGIYVTAYSRFNLWSCIDYCGRYGEDVVYCDTDSIFKIGKTDWTWYNERITNKLNKACIDMGIDPTLTRPKTRSGKEKQLGIFTEEEPCKEFITLGAKRYVERRFDDKLYLTVSGINKSAVSVLENDISRFADGLNFDKDHPDVHKRLCTYVHDMPTVKFDDGYICRYKKGINLRRNGYKLTMTDEYKELIEYGDFDIDRFEKFLRNYIAEI